MHRDRIGHHPDGTADPAAVRGRRVLPAAAHPGLTRTAVDGVQTFLPYPDFGATAEVLDQRRLGKQRVEALQVLRALTVPGYGWKRHPAVRMWVGYEEALVRYGLEICERWTARGHRDTCAAKLTAELAATRCLPAPRDQTRLAAAGELPPWLGDPELHLSHRAALVRKDPGFYGPLFPSVPADLPYVWPSSDREHQAAP